METRTLLRIVEDLEPAQTRILARLIVTLHPDVTAEVKLTLAGHSPAATPTLPATITALAWRHLPDLVYPLSTETPIEEQIAALDRSDLVGQLGAARYGGPDGYRWHIVTHAGSDAERRAWVQAL